LAASGLSPSNSTSSQRGRRTVADGNGPVVALGVIVAVGQAEAAGSAKAITFCEFSKSWLEPKLKNRPLVRSEVCKRANSAGRSFVDCMAAI